MTPLAVLADGSGLNQGEREDVHNEGDRRDQERKEHVVVLRDAPGALFWALGGNSLGTLAHIMD